jgi:hypothetical protein
LHKGTAQTCSGAKGDPTVKDTPKKYDQTCKHQRGNFARHARILPQAKDNGRSDKPSGRQGARSIQYRPQSFQTLERRLVESNKKFEYKYS